MLHDLAQPRFGLDSLWVLYVFLGTTALVIAVVTLVSILSGMRAERRRSEEPQPDPSRFLRPITVNH